MSRWLRLALTDTLSVDPSQRNRIYQARVTAREALAIAGGDMAYARAIAQLARAEVESLQRSAEASPEAARSAAVAIARGGIGRRGLAAIAKDGLTPDSVASATVPPWPLEAMAPAEIRRDTRWDALEPARRASGLGSNEFAALHGLPATYVRKCTMLMMAARRLADGRTHRARRILEMSHIRILDGDKAVRAGTPEGRALLAHLDRKEAADA